MVPLQLKDTLESFVKIRKLVPSSRFLSICFITKAVEKFLPRLHDIFILKK